MHGSSWLPWLLMGPIFIAVLGRMVDDFTDWPWVGPLWKAALLVALIVIAIAFVGGYASSLVVEKAARERRENGED